MAILETSGSVPTAFIVEQYALECDEPCVFIVQEEETRTFEVIALCSICETQRASVGGADRYSTEPGEHVQEEAEWPG
ncbi:unnamed protein product [Heligmosomoides polygyrus]|uniref:CxxH/CxxC protein n=1 Tax=Heligmosomoides polygyrus TaxID=6339 RepID=A0A183G0U9_HELPZ|nr:unnamed protein product [Heligmosomoides polygyrus]